MRPNLHCQYKDSESRMCKMISKIHISNCISTKMKKEKNKNHNPTLPQKNK